jgi:hypothetical protein
MHNDGIIHLCFSPDGKKLAAVSNDLFHTMTLFDWQHNEVLLSAQIQKVLRFINVSLLITNEHS